MTTKGLPPSIHGKLPVLFWMGNISSVFIFYGREIVLIKTAELTGAALDWAVAKCEGKLDRCGEVSFVGNLGWCYEDGEHMRYMPSTNWSQGGPIIESECIGLESWNEDDPWRADIGGDFEQFGDTPLIAAMRCYVASKLGAEVEIPD